MRFFFEEIHSIVSREERELKLSPEQAEIEAGIERLSNLGVFSIIDALANGRPELYDSILLCPYNSIFLKLKSRKEQILFNRRYQKVMRQKAEDEARNRQSRRR